VLIQEQEKFFKINSPSFQELLCSRNIAILLLLSDFLGIVLCIQISTQLRLGKFALVYDLPFLVFSMFVILGLYLGDTYRPDSQFGGFRAPARILIANLLVGSVTAAIAYLLGLWGKAIVPGRSIWLPSLLFFTLWAVLTRLWSAKWIRRYIHQRRWLLLETNSEEEMSWTKSFLSQPSIGEFTILKSTSISSLQTSSSQSLFEGLPSHLRKSWTGIIVSEHTELSDTDTRLLMQARLQGLQVMSPQDFHENFQFKIPAETLKDSWFLISAGFNLFRSRVSWKLKRVFDLVLTGFMLLLLAPIMLLAAIAIKLDSPGSVFYSQTRTGLNGEPFKVYKFRSMYQDAEKRGAQWASERDPRITRIGRWLRILRVDELPQIWNVLRGDMSLIGPRPERPEFDIKLAESIPYYNLRYLVKPGITGWAQVMYPYGASIEDAYEKFAYDLYYIKNFSFWLDIAITLKTVRVVLLGKGR
jgi:exopolysaccharide biosynthesis polyprenyl glycosylphosphotransferase